MKGASLHNGDDDLGFQSNTVVRATPLQITHVKYYTSS